MKNSSKNDSYYLLLIFIVIVLYAISIYSTYHFAVKRTMWFHKYEIASLVIVLSSITSVIFFFGYTKEGMSNRLMIFCLILAIFSFPIVIPWSTVLIREANKRSDEPDADENYIFLKRNTHYVVFVKALIAGSVLLVMFQILDLFHDIL